MRTNLTNLLVKTRGPMVAGVELATAGGGDEATASAEKMLRASRSSGKVRHGCGGAPGAISTRPRRRRWSDAAGLAAAAEKRTRRRKGDCGRKREKEGN